MDKQDLHYLFSQATGCHPNADGLRAFQGALTEEQLIKYVTTILGSDDLDEISKRAIDVGSNVTDIMLMMGKLHSIDPVFAGGVLTGMALTNHDRMKAAVKVIQGLAPVKS